MHEYTIWYKYISYLNILKSNYNLDCYILGFDELKGYYLYVIEILI